MLLTRIAVLLVQGVCDLAAVVFVEEVLAFRGHFSQCPAPLPPQGPVVLNRRCCAPGQSGCHQVCLLRPHGSPRLHLFL